MKNHPISRSPLTRVQKALLALVLLIAVGVRLWGIDFGLPYVYHPDEPNYVRRAVRMVQTGDLNPHFFNFPSFLFYANVLAYQPYLWAGKLSGRFDTIEDVTAPQMNAMGSGVTETPGTFVVGRIVALLLGLTVVWLVYLATRALYDDPWMALLATLFAALSPTQMMHSHFITPDIPQVSWVMLAFWGAVKLYRQGRWSHYLVAGAAAGAAASTKYHGVLVLVAVVVAHVMRYGNDSDALLSPKLYAALLSSAMVFFAITPYALLDFDAFWKGIAYEGRHYTRGHLGMEGNTFSWYLAYLWRIEGPVVILALLEMVRGIARRSRETLLLAAFPMVFYLFVNRFTIRNDRTLLPILPFAAILAACWIVRSAAWAEQARTHAQKGRWVAVAATALLLALSVVLPAADLVKTDFYLYYPDSAIVNRTAWVPAPWFLGGLLLVLALQTTLSAGERQVQVRLLSTGAIAVAALALPAAQTVKADLDLTTVDSRETARVWIDENLPAGARIFVESYAPYVDPIRFWVEGSFRAIEHPPAWYLDRQFEYLVFSQRMFMRFYRDPEMYAEQIAQYDRLFKRFQALKTFTDGGYEVRIYRTGVYD